MVLRLSPCRHPSEVGKMSTSLLGRMSHESVQRRSPTHPGLCPQLMKNCIGSPLRLIRESSASYYYWNLGIVKPVSMSSSLYKSLLRCLCFGEIQGVCWSMPFLSFSNAHCSTVVLVPVHRKTNLQTFQRCFPKIFLTRLLQLASTYWPAARSTSHVNSVTKLPLCSE